MNKSKPHEKIRNENIILKTLIWGIILLGTSIIIDLLDKSAIESIVILNYIVVIFSKIFSTVGLALLIGFITNKIKASENIYLFMNKKQKIKATEAMICDGNNLDGYKRQQILKLFNIEEKYRTNAFYRITVYKNEKNIVCAKTILTNKEFRGKTFSDISVGFDTPDSYISSVKIINPDNPNDYTEITKCDILKVQKSAFGSDLEYSQSCKIPARFKKMRCLDIEKEFVFLGQDHWISYAILFESPLQGVDIDLQTKDNLEIKEVTIFGDNDCYSKTQTKTTLRLHSNKWLSHNNGFLVIISDTQST